MDPNEPRFDILDASALTQRELRRIGGAFALIAAAFVEAAGPDIARAATPVSLRGGVLRLRCASSSWATTISFMQTELIERLGTLVDLEATPIKSIVATAGGMPPARPAPPAAPVLAPLDEAERSRLTQLTASIDDPLLREQVLRAMINSTRRRLETGE